MHRNQLFIHCLRNDISSSASLFSSTKTTDLACHNIKKKLFSLLKTLLYLLNLFTKNIPINDYIDLFI